MANFDDIFNSQPKEETEGQSFASFDKDEWAAQKKQERENAFDLIDETAQHMTNDGELFQSYLDVQARFDRYSVGNAILITAQKPAYSFNFINAFNCWEQMPVFGCTTLKT